jgi:hypothetical protein
MGVDRRARVAGAGGCSLLPAGWADFSCTSGNNQAQCEMAEPFAYDDV